MTFKVIDNNLVECTDENDSYMLTLEEARKLGFKVFTYEGKPITIAAFANIIRRNASTINDIISKYNYTTGEEVIAYYD